MYQFIGPASARGRDGLGLGVPGGWSHHRRWPAGRPWVGAAGVLSRRHAASKTVGLRWEPGTMSGSRRRRPPARQPACPPGQGGHRRGPNDTGGRGPRRRGARPPEEAPDRQRHPRRGRQVRLRDRRRRRRYPARGGAGAARDRLDPWASCRSARRTTWPAPSASARIRPRLPRSSLPGTPARSTYSGNSCGSTRVRRPGRDCRP